MQLPVYGNRDAARATIKREALLPVIREKRSASLAAASALANFTRCFAQLLAPAMPSSGFVVREYVLNYHFNLL